MVIQMNEFLNSDIRLLLVDDDPLVRRSLKMLFDLHDITVVGEATDRKSVV